MKYGDLTEKLRMKPLFQLSTRKYEEEIIIVQKAMEELEIKCNVKNGFLLKEASGMAGWTFFNLELSTEMLSVIEASGMMINAQGFGFNEQLKNFLGHYLETNGSNVRIKKIDYYQNVYVYFFKSLKVIRLFLPMTYTTQPPTMHAIHNAATNSFMIDFDLRRFS